ncbi:MAG: Rieske (2Fe-2S) protein [Actinomycetota bacterium]|nr:Rieske (2Fe-2S) protein [Actinomycetota bacterium]
MTDKKETRALWKERFPTETASEEDFTRREFVRYLAVASGAFAATNIGIAAWASTRNFDTGEPRPIVAVDKIPENGSYLFRYPTKDDPAILVRLSNGDLHAFSQKCTHLGCVVIFERDEEELYCPCHKGFFDASDGRATAGPPIRPLGRIAVEVRDGVVWALGAEK